MNTIMNLLLFCCFGLVAQLLTSVNKTLTMQKRGCSYYYLLTSLSFDNGEYEVTDVRLLINKRSAIF